MIGGLIGAGVGAVLLLTWLAYWILVALADIAAAIRGVEKAVRGLDDPGDGGEEDEVDDFEPTKVHPSATRAPERLS